MIAGIDGQHAITFSSTSGKEIKEVCYSPAIRNWEVPYSGVIATKDDLPSTPGSIGAQPKITAKGLLKGNGNGVVTAADETEVELVDLPTDHVSNISLPTASWTGSDPYTQTITISGSTANTKVDIQPSEEVYDQLVADNVGYLAIKNVNGTLTAVAKGGKPSVNLTVQVTYNNVN